MIRTAREIKVKPFELSNENVSVQIGAMENRESPSTIYISMGFWTRPIGDITNARKRLEHAIGECYGAVEGKHIDANPAFPDRKNNIFIVNIPENFAYNEKRNYVNLELYLHTSNVKDREKVPLMVKSPLYGSALKVAEAFVSSELMTDRKGFEVRRSNR